MRSNVAVENRTKGSVNKASQTKVTINHQKSDKGLGFFKQGQQITGVVVSAQEDVTIDFSGLRVKASKSVLGNVKPGETKTFEVVKATDLEIELKVLDDNRDNQKKIFCAAMIKDTDWEAVYNRKEKQTSQEEKEEKYSHSKEKLDEISSKMTEKDYRNLEQEGFPVEGYTISGLYTALNRVKAENSEPDKEKAGNAASFDETSIESSLIAANLPVTAENLAKIKNALAFSKAIPQMDDKAMRYLISNCVALTCENIYKACYSANNQGSTQKLSDQAWSELTGQVKNVIHAAGYEVNSENLADAKWIIENNLPLTEETFTCKKNLEEIKSESKEDIFNKIIDGMKEGINPSEVSLNTEDTASYERLLADINSISDEAVDRAVNNDDELTIKRLVSIQQKLPAGGSTDQTEAADTKEAPSDAGVKNSENQAYAKDNTYEEIKAKRQLEEIRLKMTLKAAGELSKKGISIETDRLSKVVDALRKLEDNYYKDLLKEAGADTSEASLQTLKDTVQSIDLLKTMPCSILGSTLSVRSSQTITGLATQGSKLQSDYAKAGSVYETLATVPMSEYGDSIKKAFANADSLLSQMNLDNTEANKRAIRILGYNQMEINEESISQVKAYDKQVTDLLNNLHPAVTVRLIKDGINPMDTPVNELNGMIDKIKEEQGITSEDKYSTYLRDLENNNAITGEERKAYIGIYRLLYNIDKSDGAALGSVIRADREVTLGNLLTAIQTSKKGSLNEVINEEFGTLQGITHTNDTIAQQLSSFSSFSGKGSGQNSEQSFGQNKQPEGQAAADASVEEQTEYLGRILGQMKDGLTPEKLNRVGTGLSQSAARNQAAGSRSLTDQGIWDKIKDVPVEQLLEQLQNTEEDKDADPASYTGKAQQIRELCKNSEQSIRFLDDYHVPGTPLNIMMSNSLLSNGESPIKKLLQIKNENATENSENNLKETEDLSDKLIDKNSMQEAYEQMDSDAKTALVKACEGERIDSRKLADLKSMSQQITFLRTLAQREFYQIPVETEKGITNVNLTILRGTGETGKVSVNCHSDQLGNIKAEFLLKNQNLKGFISSDSKAGLNAMQNNTGEIENAAKECNIVIKQMDYGIQGRENDTYSYQNPDDRGDNANASDQTERILYRVAKAVVRTVRTAENSVLNSDRAVS